MTGPPRLAAVVRAGEAGTAAIQTYIRRHGAAIAPFADLIARFGKGARADVVLLHQVLGAPAATLTDAALGSGWTAAKRLFGMAQRMPEGPAKIRAGLDIQRSMLSLLSRQDDFALEWTDEITAALLASRKAAADEALKLAPALAHSTGDLAGAKALARLSAEMPAASPELRALWALYLKAVRQTDAGLLKAATLAAEGAADMKRLLRSRGMRAVDRRNQLWGYLSNVRGALGEAYALSDEAWLAIKADELIRAHKLAATLGPGYEVRYLTQADNLLLLNGREGPDAVIVLINRNQAQPELIDVTQAQVKVARVSQGAEQSANDVWRRIGEERAAAAGMPAWYTFTADDVTESFLVVARPEVVPRVVLLNAAGSRTPRADLEVLNSLGLDVTEGGLSLSVKQLTHLAISLCESAIKNL